ncbi:N-acetylmuramic acid 6-phosphate etherase [Enterococcus timonensis]|uniref:N-acetylmuramic acid 6-phosphate etherase n=1 Tax=Enterococcus timonensis TaxID=1852364 RepID=UPI0008DAEBA8|nr:N-acetylmuramic acid 6-phosphate etherase [Enterococcus timonensis]
MDLKKLKTETRNPSTMHLDQMSVKEILQQMNREDQFVPQAIAQVLPQIEVAVKKIIMSFENGGRLIYFGAGTSGRLGVLDAAECVPTFGVDPTQVLGLIAGGSKAMTVAVEGAEDDQELGAQDLAEINLNAKDTVVGIAASGRTPYVLGGLKFAQSVGATTVSLACNAPAEISKFAQIPIEVVVGPEVLTGSTRLKAGTAQKLILNMLSTCSMIGIGKVFQNLMVDVLPTNKKLVERAIGIIIDATNCPRDIAEKTFRKAGKNVKVAIVMILADCSKEEAIEKLKKGKGFIHLAVQS